MPASVPCKLEIFLIGLNKKVFVKNTDTSTTEGEELVPQSGLSSVVWKYF